MVQEENFIINPTKAVMYKLEGVYHSWACQRLNFLLGISITFMRGACTKPQLENNSKVGLTIFFKNCK